MYKKAILHFKKADPALYEITMLVTELELTMHKDPFARLTRSIIGQQLSVKAASTIYARFENLFRDNKITPEGILKLSDEKLREVGISYQKIGYLKDLSKKIQEKDVDLKKIQELEDENVILELTKIKGIGRWTAEMYLMFTLGRPDVFSFGDLGLQNAIQKIYKLKKKPTIKQMEKITKKWSPFRTYAAMLLWRSLNNTP